MSPVREGTLPFPAVAVAAAGLLGGTVATLTTAVGLILVSRAIMGSDPPRALLTLVGLISLWTCLWTSCRVASRRYGTGHLTGDLGLGWSWLDPLRGVGANIVGRFSATVVAVPLVAAGWTASNTDVIRAQRGSPWSLVLVGSAAVIGAPIFEELFFRGLLLRSLASRLGWGWATVVQGVVFGVAHADPTGGWSTLSLVAITGTFGMCQGWFARRWSLGPLIVSHALFNLLPVLLIALG